MRGTLTASNAAAGLWSDGRLPVTSIASTFAVDGERIQLDGLDATLGEAGRVTGAAALDRSAATWQLAVRDLDLHRIVADLNPTRLGGAFAGRMRIDTGAADGEISGDLRQSDVALAFRAAVGQGVVDVKTFRAQARGGTLQGTARLALADTLDFKVDATATALNPASFGNYPVASLSGKASAQGALKPAWSAALSFELGRNSSLRGRPLAGAGKLALAPGSMRDARVELDVGANHLNLTGNLAAAATCGSSRWTRAIRRRSMRGSADACAPTAGSAVHGTDRRSRSPPPARAFASAPHSPRQRSLPKARSAPVLAIVRYVFH